MGPGRPWVPPRRQPRCPGLPAGQGGSRQRAQIEADTSVIKARGEAESINIRGKALKETPMYVDSQIVERWDGITPLVVGPGASGANMLLPLGNMRTGDQSTEK